MRFVVAGTVAMGLVAGGLLYAQWSKQAVKESIRDSLRKQKRDGTLPPELAGLDVETADVRQFDVRLSPAAELQMALANFLSDYWFLWAFVVVAAAIGVAAVMPGGAAEPPAQPPGS